jgi:hypothetical protein
MEREAARAMAIAAPWVPVRGTVLPELALKGIPEAAAMLLVTAQTCAHCEDSALRWNQLVSALRQRGIPSRVIILDISTATGADGLMLPSTVSPTADSVVAWPADTMSSFGIKHSSFLPTMMYVDIPSRRVRRNWLGSLHRYSVDAVVEAIAAAERSESQGGGN